MDASPEQLQHAFYTATAASYDREFVTPGDEHGVALRYISVLLSGSDCRSVLDVGAGTGRGVRHFIERHPELEVRGVEPVQAMIDVAEREHGVPAGLIAQGGGERLPFGPDSFDAVCELGVLHHVAEPERVVREMTRVARRAVFLSDENRFGRGRGVARVAKYALHRAGVWDAVWRTRTHGRGYHRSADGVSYSYSVYDSLGTLGEWADRVFVIPTGPAGCGRFHPLFGAAHVLVCALRDQ